MAKMNYEKNDDAGIPVYGLDASGMGSMGGLGSMSPAQGALLWRWMAREKPEPRRRRFKRAEPAPAPQCPGLSPAPRLSESQTS